MEGLHIIVGLIVNIFTFLLVKCYKFEIGLRELDRWFIWFDAKSIAVLNFCYLLWKCYYENDLNIRFYFKGNYYILGYIILLLWLNDILGLCIFSLWPNLDYGLF